MVLKREESPNRFMATLMVIVIGVLVAATVQFGIQAFYPRPKYPDYPASLSVKAPGDVTRTEEDKTAQAEYEQKTKEHERKQNAYAKVSISVGLIIAIILVILTLTLLRGIYLISDGVMLGAVFSLIVSIFSNVDSFDLRFQFGVVVVSLILVLGLVYNRFSKQAQ